MTSRDEIRDVKALRDDLDADARRRGHDMSWRLGPNATRKDHAYFWVGDCVNCGANMRCALGSSSCQGVRDARKVACSGPGTVVLTEIEAGRALELAADAVAEFGRQVAENLRRAQDD
ncbi:hypothetical protein [Nonomuraea sp. NPDC023979]|uniref:hypothetical protein n=1 Tax=Nonomuraea sp. NPDC023979 TaxID=3154796 RepID=UPI0034085191